MFFRLNDTFFEDWTVLVALLMTGLLGLLSYRYIEVPFRFHWKGKKVTYVIFAAPIFFALFFLHLKTAVPSLVDFQITGNGMAKQAYLSKVSGPDAAKILNIDQLNEHHRLTVYNYAEKSNCEIILLGDSHSLHLQEGLANVLDNPARCRLIAMQSIGCPPFFGYTYTGYEEFQTPKILSEMSEVERDCAKMNAMTENYIKDNAKNISTVILNARWNWLISPIKMVPKVEERVLIPSNLPGDKVRSSEKLSQSTRYNNFEKALAKSLQVFGSLGLSVNYISQPPLQKIDLRDRFTIEKFYEAQPDFRKSFERNNASENAFKSMLNNQFPNARYIPLMHLFCPHSGSKCKNRIGYRSLYWDEDHLSDFGAEYVSRYLNKVFEENFVY